MSKKIMKRIACSVLAFASVAACATTATACETSHPKVEMTIEFNGGSYTLEYKLYRKLAPSTVKQFLWLAGNGYYDELCVHNYDSTGLKMYTGGYSVAKDEGDEDGLEYRPYYETIAKFENYADFPVSVWMNDDKTDPTYTVYGEFSDNAFTVDNGALKQSYGSLTMFYHTKNTDEKVYTPYLRKDKEGELAPRAYKYNSATSLFYISLSTSESTNTKYTTFATLEGDSVEVLESLQEAIADFIEAEYGTDEEEATASDFTTQYTVKVDEDDPFVGDNEPTQSFRVPNEPIVIKSVKVLKF